MSKEVFAKRWQSRDFLVPLLILPYGYLAIYWFENGFNWVVAVLGAVLFFILLPIIIVLWDKR
jgi:hypothetical protein